MKRIGFLAGIVSLALVAPPVAVRADYTIATDQSKRDSKIKNATNHDVWVNDGNSIVRQSTITPPRGGTTKRRATTTRQGNKVTRDVTVRGPRGKTAPRNANWTKNGNTVTRQGTTTGPNGKTVTRQGTTTQEKDIVTQQERRTGPNGRSVTTYTNAPKGMPRPRHRPPAN